MTLKHGAVVIAAITSCTNTSNPSVMVAAGLLAKKAVERGLQVKPWVKTSLAPGSKVVTRYLDAAGLTPYLEALRFHTVGYGCTTCIGNSGPLPEHIGQGSRRGQPGGRRRALGQPQLRGPHPSPGAGQLPGQPAAGRGLCPGRHGRHRPGQRAAGARSERRAGLPAGHLADQEEIRRRSRRSLKPEMFQQQYGHVFDGNEIWNKIPMPEGELYAWDAESTYIQEPPFFIELTPEPAPVRRHPGRQGAGLSG